MGRLLPVILILAATIFTLVHLAQADSAKVRVIPKILWLLMVLVLPIVGMIGWWIFGRPIDEVSPPPMAPDDDPDFLRGL